MMKKYLPYLSILILFILLLGGYNTAYANHYVSSLKDSTKTKVKGIAKISDTRSNKPSYIKKGVKVNFVPFNPNEDRFGGNFFDISAKTIVMPNDDKVLNNVKVYPNPVSDLLNLTYRVNKDANVTIKIMDVLGNEIATLLSERIAAGEQTSSFNIASRLNSGFYFVRFNVGNETVIKRISVL